MPAPLPEPKTKIDRSTLDHVARFGWSVIGVAAGVEGPGFSYSVGLFHTLGQPELLVMGLGITNGLHLINAVGERMRGGEKFAAGHVCPELANNPTAFVGMSRRHAREHLRYAGWLYHWGEFPAVQLVWPDKAGAFPWEPGYDARFFALQRVLGPADGLPHGWPFPDPRNVATFTTRFVIREGHPILLVTRDPDDGSWQFHSGEPVTPADGMIVCLEEMLKHDPTLAELGNLLPGSRATRPDANSRWEVSREER